MKIRESNPADLDALLEIWIRSVRATHTFLTEDDIQALLPEARSELALPSLELWVLCSDDTRPIGFVGLSGSSVEALFVAPDQVRRGGGRLLLDHARRQRGALSVDVNEQNPEAVNFYLENGFEVIGRSPTDRAGRPFPLLHMREAPREAAARNDPERKVQGLRPDHEVMTQQRLPYFIGISGRTVNASGLSMHLVVIPAGARAEPHVHVGYETGIYVLEGTVLTRWGASLEHEVVSRPGDFLFVPPGVPHEAINLSSTEPARAVVARNDPAEQDKVEPYSVKP
jgi:uncharacterized RmlC-like cupin family protein/GNAT superfamily N-acetyltransferase